MSRVVKLDDPQQFKEIETGIKTTAPFRPKSPPMIQYNAWYNYFKKHGGIRLPSNRSSITWVATNHKKIHAYIEANYNPEKNKQIAPATFRIHSEAFANILLAIDKRKFKEYTRPIFNLGLSHQKSIDQQRKENLLKPKEIANFVCFPDLEKARDEYFRKWMADPKNKKLNMNHLILAMNTYIPPLRLTLIYMQIWRGESQPPDDVETNYLWKKPDGKYVIVINYDKVENKKIKNALKKGYEHHRSMFDLDHEIRGVTNGKVLQKILDDSLKFFPGEYVLSAVRGSGEFMDKSSYSSAFATIFKAVGKKPTQNLIRKAYINHWHRLIVDTNRKEEIAKRMRHSVTIAETSYVKVNVPCPHPLLNPGSQLKVNLLPEKIDIPPPVKKEYFSPAKYAKEYRAKHAEKLKKQRQENYKKNSSKVLAKKVIWNLNHAAVTNPRASTIDKYKLKYNAKLKMWESDLFN